MPISSYWLILGLILGLGLAAVGKATKIRELYLWMEIWCDVFLFIFEHLMDLSISLKSALQKEEEPY